MKKYRILVIFLLLALLFSCSSKSYLFMADNLYNKGQIYKSCDKYALAYDKIGNKNYEKRAQLAEKIGDIYSSVNEYNKAYLWFKKSLFTKDTLIQRCQKVISLAYSLNKINDVIKYQEKYHISLDTNKLFSSPRRCFIKAFDKVNSRYDDFSPSFMGRDTTRLYFSSNRKVPELKLQYISPVTGTSLVDIYKTEFTDELVTEVVAYGKKKEKDAIPVCKTVLLDSIQWIKPSIVTDELINTIDDDGTLCFNIKGTKAYFSSSRKYEGRYVGCKLYSADVSNKGKFTNIKILNIVGDTVNIGHPAISPSEDRLYYASTMDGGFGKSDIWFSINLGDTWSVPINAGKDINTSGNEMYPSFDDRGNLYISSDGHKGFGGLDIFKVSGEYGEYKVENLAYPFNSRSDDFGIVYVPGYDKGYLTSSRGVKGDDDIYYFEYNPYTFTLRLEIVDKKGNLPVKNAFVVMTDTNGKNIKVNSNEYGVAELKWAEKSEANFVVQGDGYLKAKFSLDTRFVEKDTIYDKHFALNRMDTLIDLPTIFYGFAMASLSEESKRSLSSLILLLNDNPNVTMELSSHSDIIGDESSNQVLSQARAQAVVNYLVKMGIARNRLIARGYGESRPKTVTEEDAKEYSFLKVGQLLSPSYVRTLSNGEQKIVNKLNRRTEFRVIRQDYPTK